MKEMTNAQQADQRWRDDMDKQFGWMTFRKQGFSFECSMGWKFILEDLFRRIDFAMLDPAMREEFQVTQIKEKFGTLRFYYSGGNEAVEAHVRVTEEMSEFTCERCGQRGAIHSDGWMRVRCDPCLEKEMAK